ncbi:unnamed protein product [Urochloa humidicola]
MKKKYFDFQLRDNNSGWEDYWCLVDSEVNDLPSFSTQIPANNGRWNKSRDEPDHSHLEDLYTKIAKLKSNHGVTAEAITFSWVERQVQPLAKKGFWGFKYKGKEDPSRMSPEDLSDEEVMTRVRSMLPRVTERPVMPALFSVDRPPRVEDVEKFYSWPEARVAEVREDNSLLDLLPNTLDLPRGKRKLSKRKPPACPVVETSASPADDSDFSYIGALGANSDTESDPLRSEEVVVNPLTATSSAEGRPGAKWFKPLVFGQPKLRSIALRKDTPVILGTFNVTRTGYEEAPRDVIDVEIAPHEDLSKKDVPEKPAGGAGTSLEKSSAPSSFVGVETSFETPGLAKIRAQHIEDPLLEPSCLERFFARSALMQECAQECPNFVKEIADSS